MSNSSWENDRINEGIPRERFNFTNKDQNMS